MQRERGMEVQVPPAVGTCNHRSQGQAQAPASQPATDLSPPPPHPLPPYPPAAEHHVDAASQGAELGGDALPRLAPHHHRILRAPSDGRVGGKRGGKPACMPRSCRGKTLPAPQAATQSQQRHATQHRLLPNCLQANMAAKLGTGHTCFAGSLVRLVSSLKYFMSPGRLHGRLPPAATQPGNLS